MPLPTLAQQLFLGVLPSGGQRTARRNAWAGMSADATRARAQRDADDALAAASLRHQQRRSTGS